MTLRDMPRRPLLFLGTSNLDMVCFTEALPVRGESVMGRIEQFAGGKGANQAVCAGRLGGRPLFVTLLGDDEPGALLRSSFAQSGVREDGLVTVPGKQSGRSLIFVDGDGSNLIGIDAGANLDFGPEHVDKALALIEEPAVLVAEMGLPEAAFSHLFENKGHHCLIFNPAPVTAPLSDADCRAIDILTPNETEAEALTGIRIATTQDALTAAYTLVARGCRSVVVTLGEKGAVYVDTERELTVPAFDVDVVDTTAAGDAFSGGLAVAIAIGMEIDAAIRSAMAVAALSVTRKGAQSSLPDAREVESLLQQRGAGA